MNVPRRSDWLSPGTILGILGMLGAIAGSWMMFESRITAAEQAVQFNRQQIVDTRDDLRAINDKLDRLIERRER